MWQHVLCLKALILLRKIFLANVYNFQDSRTIFAHIQFNTKLYLTDVKLSNTHGKDSERTYFTT